MNVYSRFIFPYILDASMSSSMLVKYRQQILDRARGEVLEIGFGTGLNLPYYPKTVQKIVAVDPNPTMKKLAQKRIAKSPIAVEFLQLSGEVLPIAENRFDSVVCTWTLCSIPNLKAALQEIYRVLKPGGRFFFVEHGLSPDRTVQVWQNRLNPIQNKIGDGCNLNRDIAGEIEAASFHIEELDRHYVENTPKFLGYFYCGVASKS